MVWLKCTLGVELMELGLESGGPEGVINVGLETWGYGRRRRELSG